MRRNTAEQCRLELLLDSDFVGDVEDSISTSGGILCIFGDITFVPISWMCNKQTAVSPTGCFSISPCVFGEVGAKRFHN